MDKNQATGLILLFGILFAYFTFFAPRPEEMPEVKKEAAKKKCHIVYLLTTTGQAGNSNSGFSGGTKSSVTGVAYKY